MVRDGNLRGLIAPRTQHFNALGADLITMLNRSSSAPSFQFWEFTKLAKDLLTTGRLAKSAMGAAYESTGIRNRRLRACSRMSHPHRENET
jgi:hypothetical protein